MCARIIAAFGIAPWWTSRSPPSRAKSLSSTTWLRIGTYKAGLLRRRCAALLRFFLMKVNPTSHWHDRLKAHLSNLPPFLRLPASVCATPAFRTDGRDNLFGPDRRVFADG